jgi:hypothetical protein
MSSVGALPVFVTCCNGRRRLYVFLPGDALSTGELSHAPAMVSQWASREMVVAGKEKAARRRPWQLDVTAIRRSAARCSCVARKPTPKKLRSSSPTWRVRRRRRMARPIRARTGGEQGSNDIDVDYGTTNTGTLPFTRTSDV